MALTGIRLQNRDIALNARRIGLLTAAEYATIKNRLERQEKAYQRKKAKREAEREAREEAELQRALAAARKKDEERRVARNLKAKERRAATKLRKLKKDNVVLEVNAEMGHAWLVEEVFKKLPVGSYRMVIFDKNGNVHEDKKINRTEKYKEFSGYFMLGSDGWIYESGDKIVFMRPNELPARSIEQMFRDGRVSHCVFEPIKNELRRRIEVSGSKQMKQRYSSRLDKMIEMEKEYDAGVPVDKMPEVAKASGFTIYIKHHFQPADEKKALYAWNEANGRGGKLWFDNTRENHIDISHLTSNDKPTPVSKGEMRRLFAEAKQRWAEEKRFFHFQYLYNGVPKKLFTLDGVYAIRDADDDIINDFSSDLKLSKYRINATKHADVNEFIKSGRLINAWPSKIKGGRVTGHVDMKKAYAQFKKCHLYSGFLGMIHQWGKGDFDAKFIKEHIGIYRCTVATDDKLLLKLGYTGVMTLPSVEILYLIEKGATVQIHEGVWGSRMDFDFTPEMLENRRYCKWAGMLSMEHAKKEFSFYATPEWAAHLKAEYGDNVEYFEADGICHVKMDKDSIYTTHHILAFITAYVRIQMLEAMNKFEYENLRCVVMDGIYFEGDMPNLGGLFESKPLKKQDYFMPWYSASENVETGWKPIQYTGNTLLTGQGGAGKTYSILTHGQYNKILFITPQHVLGGEVAKKYSVAYETIHKLIGIDTVPFKDSKYYPPVVLIDELTQIPADWVSKVFEMYPESLILMAGDLNGNGQWFQCRSGTPTVGFSPIWKPNGVDVVEVLGDRRSRDSELKALKLEIRAKMMEVFAGGDSGEEHVMKQWAMKRFKGVNFFDAAAMFQAGDSWIAGTHATNQKLLALGVVSGWYKKGGFVSHEEKEGWEKRGSFTIHAYQGKTIETGKVFISLGDMFEYAMLYTAVSRAVHFDQLVFVM